jgi:hypothetical protein
MEDNRGTEEPIFCEERQSSGRQTQIITICHDRFDRKLVAKSGLAYFYCNERDCTERISARYSSKARQNEELPEIENMPVPPILRNGSVHPPNTEKRLKELAKHKIKEKIAQDPLRSIPVIYEEVVFEEMLPNLSDPTERIKFLQSMPASHNNAK